MAFVDNFQDFIKYHAEAAGMTREEYMAVLMSEAKKKPGPDPYHRGLEDDEVEDKEEQIKKQAKMDDDDPDAYKEMPGDKEAREKGEVKTSKATKAYNKLYGEDLDEGTMSDIHQMAGEVKSEEEFIKKFFKEYGAKIKKTKDSEEWAKSLYNDMNESKVNEMAMGYDAHTGLFYFQGVPFTQERLEQALKYLRTKLKLGKLPKQFSYYPALQVADNAGMEIVTLDLQDAKKIEDVLKRFKGKLAHDGDFDEEIIEANHSGNEASDKMAFSQLERIIDYATMLRDRMAAGKGLDAWMYGKIVKAEDYLNTLYDVVDGDDGVVETQKMTKKDWKKIKKFNKHITDSGEKFVMSYDDRIGTFLEPVEIVDEANVKNLSTAELRKIIKQADDERVSRAFAMQVKAALAELKKRGESVVEILDEGVLSDVRKAVEKTKKALKKNWAKKGGYENFGQDEVRDLEDKYDYNSMLYGTPEERNAAKLIDGLNQWAMNYVGESTVNEAFKFGKKNQYTIDDVNEAYGFWGTLEAGGFKVREIEDCWHSAMAWLTEAYKFSDAGALYYLNAKAGRWVADQVIENKGYKDVVDVLEDYATPNEWKKWSKEYNKFAKEDLVESTLNEEKAEGDRGPIDDDAIETALKKKADETGVPIGIIRVVMRRGMAAWKSGHRPGANQQQWGYARVNAFLTKGEGTWGNADKDLAKEVRDGGHDKKLKKG